MYIYARPRDSVYTCDHPYYNIIIQRDREEEENRRSVVVCAAAVMYMCATAPIRSGGFDAS